MSLFERPVPGERWVGGKPRRTRTVTERTLGRHVLYLEGDARPGRSSGERRASLDEWLVWQEGARELAPARSWQPRTTFLDYDSRPEPKTAVYCVMCQRDLPLDAEAAARDRWVRLVPGEPMVIHPEDDRHPRPYQSFRIGPCCARKLGSEWIRRSP